MKIQVSNEVPLFHQIAFSNLPNSFRLNKFSLRIENQVGKQNYRLWDLTSTRDFLTKHYDSSVLDAFEILEPFAFKSDLARYCIINHFGGFYGDLSVNSLSLVSTKDLDMILFRDGNSDRTSWKVINGFFYSKPNNPILEHAIQQIVENVRHKYYGHDPHFPTGPSVLGRAVVCAGLDLNLLVGQHWWFKYRKNKFVLPGNRVVARHKRGGAFNGGNSGILGGNNYNEIWKARLVYGESQNGLFSG